MATERHTDTGEENIIVPLKPDACGLLHIVLCWDSSLYHGAVLRARLSLLVVCHSVMRPCWGRTTAQSPWQTGLATGTSTSSSTSGGSSGW